MITLKKNGLLYKWAYFWTDPTNRPTEWDPTTLCKLFWRCVLLQPLKLTIIAFFASFIGYFVFTEFVAVALAVGVILAILATLGGIAFASDHVAHSEWIEAKKRKYCPFIEFK